MKNKNRKNKDLEDLRYELEMTMATACYQAELEAEKSGKEFSCKCKDPWKMNKDEVKELLFILKKKKHLQL